MLFHWPDEIRCVTRGRIKGERMEGGRLAKRTFSAAFSQYIIINWLLQKSTGEILVSLFWLSQKYSSVL